MRQGQNWKNTSDTEKARNLGILYDAMRYSNPLLNRQSFGQGTPISDFTVAGYPAWADGTNWNPVSEGAGLYLYKGGAWTKVITSEGPQRIGDYDGGNYTEIEADGTIKCVGNATTWDDLPPTPILISRLGATAPTLATFQGNVEAYAFAVNDYCEGATEVTHKYKEGTNLSVHMHWATNGSEGSDKAVKWQLEYTISNLKSAAPFTAAFPASTTISAETTIPASTADRAHILTSLGTITGTSVTVGAYIIWRLTRIASAGTAPAAGPFGLALGVHVEQDTMGTRTISTK